MKKLIKTVQYMNDILPDVNVTAWIDIENGKKTSTIIKISISDTDVVLGVSPALEDFQCNDKVCCALDLINSLSRSNNR